MSNLTPAQIALAATYVAIQFFLVAVRAYQDLGGQ